MAAVMPPIDPGTGRGWVSVGPEADTVSFVEGIEHLGAPPPARMDPEHMVYMQQRRAFHEAISLVAQQEKVRESDGTGGSLNNVGSESAVTSQIR